MGYKLEMASGWKGRAKNLEFQGHGLKCCKLFISADHPRASSSILCGFSFLTCKVGGYSAIENSFEAQDGKNKFLCLVGTWSLSFLLGSLWLSILHSLIKIVLLFLLMHPGLPLMQSLIESSQHRYYLPSLIYWWGKHCNKIMQSSTLRWWCWGLNTKGLTVSSGWYSYWIPSQHSHVVCSELSVLHGRRSSLSLHGDLAQP